MNCPCYLHRQPPIEGAPCICECEHVTGLTVEGGA